MDHFSLCLNGFCLAAQSVMHMVFVSRFTGKRHKIWQLAMYLFLLCIIESLSDRFALPGILSVCAGAIALYSMSRFALGNDRPSSCAAAMIAVYILQLSFGVVNSVESIIFPNMVGKPLLYLLVLLATLAVFALCALCYAVTLKYLSLAGDEQTPYIGVLLFPGLFFFAAQLYILRTSYETLPAAITPELAGKQGLLLSLQVLGLAALLCTLYAYQHICRSFQAQAALRSLAQAAHTQKIHVAEAQMRYERTKAFRHDIANHLSVLDGLLSGGKLEESRAYLHKLKTVSASLSFPYQTGNPVVDILLREKLGLAKELTAEVSLILPRPCGIDDLDLCVIFANALDNAIHACRSAEGEGLIRIRGERQGDFYMLAFENTCSDGPLPPAGTGLSNIKAAAEKYHGAMLAEKSGRRFSLNVLLNISLQPGSSSDQTP